MQKLLNYWIQEQNRYEKLNKAIFILIGFLLARAVFFEIAAPFFIPFYALAYLYTKKYTKQILLAGLIGALTLSIGQLLILVLELLLIHTFIQMTGNKRIAVKITTTVFLGQFIWQTIYYQQIPTNELLILIGIEVVLTLFMTLFLKPLFQLLFEKEGVNFTSQYLISTWIVLAIILTGATTIQVSNFNLALFMIHLFICCFARYFQFHVVVGATTVIASLYSFASFSFTAMIALYVLTAIAVSYAQAFPKWVSALLSFAPSIFFFLYDITLPLDSVYFFSISCATIVYLFTPNFSKEENATQIFSNQQVVVEKEPLKEAVAYLTFLQQEISKQIKESNFRSPNNKAEQFSACTSCMKFQQCWRDPKAKLPYFTDQWSFYFKINRHYELLKTEEKIARVCIRKERLLQELSKRAVEQMSTYQIQQAKKMFALQLSDVIQYTSQHLYSKKQGRIGKQPRFQLQYKVFSRSKNKHFINGDAHLILNVTSNLTAFLLSDGMGSNEEARKHSEQLLIWMERLLKFQVNPETAMQTVHYLYSLKQSKDIYATLDMALIDSVSGKLYCFKAGGISTYIIRHQEVVSVQNYSPPIGSSNDFFITIDEQQLKSNDMIVLISDGLFSSHYSWEEQDQFFQQTLQKILRKNIQIQAILYELMDEYTLRYPLTDDCTIILIEVKHIQNNWQSANLHLAEIH